jgi:hypothetical protein
MRLSQFAVGNFCGLILCTDWGLVQYIRTAKRNSAPKCDLYQCKRASSMWENTILHAYGYKHKCMRNKSLIITCSLNFSLFDQ